MVVVMRSIVVGHEEVVVMEVRHRDHCGRRRGGRTGLVGCL